MAAQKPKISTISTLERVCIKEEQLVSKEARQEGPMPSIVDEIMKDLTQPNISIFGVYRSDDIDVMRKVSVLAQINKRVERDGLFDAVVMASVTYMPYLKSIQVELGNKLGLQLNEILSLKERASRLCDKIKTLEKILIILGYLEDEINLGKIGIPFGNDHKGCKILLVASSQEVLSHMKTQKEYCVDNEAEMDDMVEMDDSSYMYLSLCLPRMEDVYFSASSNGREILFDSEGMKSKLNEMIIALTQPNKSIVGVHGSRYTRKRQVVEQIKRRVERDGLFDVVVKASVVNKHKRRFYSSKSADVERIQGELANQLHLQLNDKTSLEERATLLCHTIKTIDNILIILDDIQARIDLGQIGIPFGNDHMGSKIVLVAQTSEVLSNQMNPPNIQFSVDD